ncbi:ATPase AAA [Arthrobacter sp. NtRootA4]|nr:ATPase AAA [Arthrobacter sp. NtRootA2]BCW15604.1 ATPase AAA [Arthrobacter sp. NtRootA4]BCW23938.1 ATPase AAA [Arthrobacter sp. NtRootC7]BCW28206.1 ATPase AAA [Arthrobacter sp. NtRootC45]BCW32476.1 ATPase AAA [Arthrobacter sp. NtRootD5]
MAAKNPFKPTAGARPPLLIGRDDMRQDFAESIENGPGAPGLLSIFTGPRGIGKTVMLGEIEDEAIEHGWIVISETATDGLVDRIGSAVRAAAEELGDGPAGRRITGVTLGILRVDTQLPAVREVHWRRQITELLEKLSEQDTGLLISIDEIHAVDRTELSEIAAVVQHLIRESLPIGLVLAGLPKSVEDLLNEGVSTFLRRAEKYDLHRTSIDEVAEAFRDTFSESGVSISDEHLRQLAEATGGYPFLIQLVGYHVWSQARKSGAVVTDEALAAGVQKARRRMGATVLQSAYSALSDVDQSYLLAMAEDDGPSSTTAIAERLGVNAVYGGQYRLRLLAAGVIETTSRGYVDFAVPTFREFLRDTPAYGLRLQHAKH